MSESRNPIVGYILQQIQSLTTSEILVRLSSEGIYQVYLTVRKTFDIAMDDSLDLKGFRRRWTSRCQSENSFVGTPEFPVVRSENSCGDTPDFSLEHHPVVTEHHRVENCYLGIYRLMNRRGGAQNLPVKWFKLWMRKMTLNIGSLCGCNSSYNTCLRSGCVF